MDRSECLRRFMAAVQDGRNGDFVKAQTIIHNIRQSSGDKAAETARRELFKYIRSESPVNAVAVSQESKESPESTPTKVRCGGRTVRIR